MRAGRGYLFMSRDRDVAAAPRDAKSASSNASESTSTSIESHISEQSLFLELLSRICLVQNHPPQNHAFHHRPPLRHHLQNNSKEISDEFQEMLFIIIFFQCSFLLLLRNHGGRQCEVDLKNSIPNMQQPFETISKRNLNKKKQTTNKINKAE